MKIQNLSIFSLTASFFLTQTLAFAEPTKPNALTTTSVPDNRKEALFQPELFCSRSFVFKHQVHPVDSSRKQDGEGLRFLFKKTSQAEILLNEYQNSRKASNWTAYIGTTGGAIALTGFFYTTFFMNERTQVEQRNYRFAIVGVGALIGFGGYLYGQYALKQNEKILEKAIQTYNDAAPESERIQVSLTPVISLDKNKANKGGEVKAKIPF